MKVYLHVRKIREAFKYKKQHEQLPPGNKQCKSAFLDFVLVENKVIR